MDLIKEIDILQLGKGVFLWVGLNVKKLYFTRTQGNLQGLISSWLSFGDGFHLLPLSALTQGIYLKQCLAFNGQSPICEQSISINFNPRLDQARTTKRQITRQQ